MAAGKRPPPGQHEGPDGTVDLQAMERHRRLLEAQDAVNTGKVPFVHPAVRNPQAIRHAMGAAQRAGERADAVPPVVKGRLQKYNQPVAGGAPPPMPALEQEPQKGTTMAAQAAASRAPADQAAVHRALQGHAARQGSIIQDGGGRPPPQEPPQRRAGPPLLLLPTDTLPQEALKDPMFQRGTGSMLAQLQPQMAAKYGIIRAGRHVTPEELAAMAQGGQSSPGAPPQDFRRGMQRPPRSAEETARDLQAALSATQQGGRPPQRGAQVDDGSPPPPAGMPRSDEEADQQAAEGPGGAAAKAGAPPTPAVLSEDDAALTEALQNMGDLDVEAIRREMIRDILKNPDQKEIIERRLKPFDQEDLSKLLDTNTIRQRVPVVPGVFEPTFESMDQDVEFALKQLLMLESKSVNVTEAYLMDKYAVMTTAAGTVMINNNPLPSMYTAQGDFDADLFWKKFTWLSKKPLHMLASLGIHYAWFEGRVRRLFKVEEIKNG